MIAIFKECMGKYPHFINIYKSVFNISFYGYHFLYFLYVG